MIRSTGYPHNIGTITVGLALFVAACAIPVEPQFKFETSAYRSFPSTARVQKTCVIEVIGMNEFNHVERGLSYSFDPRATLREALVYGLERTCLRATADPRAGDSDALDFAREIGVLANVTAVLMRVGHFAGGPDDMDEAKVVASITLFRGGTSPVRKVVEGQNAGYDDSVIALAVIDTVDGVNQLIFDNRKSLRTSPEKSREESENEPSQ